MKKILMTWAICLAFAGLAKAETEYYWFDYGNAEGWTTIDADGDGYCWFNSKELDGNNAGYLSIQIDKLSAAEYISVTKTQEGSRPRTLCKITDNGREAMNKYVEALRSYLTGL